MQPGRRGMADGQHVCISYAHADEDYVARLVEHLRREDVDAWWADQIATSSAVGRGAGGADRNVLCGGGGHVASGAGLVLGSQWNSTTPAGAAGRSSRYCSTGSQCSGWGVLQYESAV